VHIFSFIDDGLYLPFNYSLNIVRSFWDASVFVMVFVSLNNLAPTEELFILIICLLSFSKLLICQGMLLLIQ